MYTRPFFLFLAFLGLGGNSFCQDDYNKRLAEYQLQYKSNLADVIQSDTAHVRFYPVDTAYKVKATVQRLQGEKFFNLPASDGKTKQAIRFAIIKFRIKDVERQLYAYQLSSLLNSADYKDIFFVPFTDGSSGHSSYGGGRYIDFEIKDIAEDGTIELDFNKAYNPYCAFKEGYSCPIPPKENDLPFEILAGEKLFLKENK